MDLALNTLICHKPKKKKMNKQINKHEISFLSLGRRLWLISLIGLAKKYKT